MEFLSINEHHQRINESKELLQLGMRKVNKIELKFIKLLYRLKNFFTEEGTLTFDKVHYSEYPKLIEEILASPFGKWKSIKRMFESALRYAKRDEAKGTLSTSTGTTDRFFEVAMYATGLQLLDKSNYSIHNIIADTFFKLDITKPIYTYLNPVQSDDIAGLLTVYLSTLSNSITPTRIKADLIQPVLYALYSKKAWFKQLSNDIEQYTGHNNKNALQSILKTIKKHPILTKLSKQYATKNLPEEVFRGIEEPTQTKDSELVKTDREKDMIPVSTMKAQAAWFANRSDEDPLYGPGETRGFVFTYKIKPSDILLDFRLIGSWYNEGEIIVDPKNIKLYYTEKY